MTEYPLWYGYIDDYDTLFHVGLGEVTIPATDALRVLAGVTFDRSVYETAVLDDAPLAYWPLSGTGLVAPDESGNRYDGQWQRATSTKRNIAGPRPGGFGATFPDEQYLAKVRTDARPRLTTLPYSVEFWVETDTLGFIPISQGPGTDGNQLTILIADLTGAGEPGEAIIDWTTTIDGADHAIWTTLDSSTTFTSTPINDGLPHHVVLTIDASENFAVYVDGQPIFTDEATPVPIPGDPIVTLGGWYYEDGSGGGRGGSLSDVAFYESELTVEQVQAHYDAAWTPWDGDTTGERITRVLDYIGWPAGLRAIDGGEVFLGPADLSGRTALDVIQEAVQSEGGRFFQAPNGDLTFHDATRFQRETVETTSQVTFTDTTDGVLYEKGIRFRRSFRDVIDAMTVTRAGGTAQSAGSTTSGHGRTLSTGHRDDNQARNLAERIVARYGDPATRVDGWTTQPQVDGENFWPELLARELGDRITIEGTPLSQGSTISIEQHLDSISHEVGATFRMSFTGQPVDPNEGTYLTWGGDGATQGWATGSWR